MLPAPRWTRALLLDAFSERRVAITATVALLAVLSLRAALVPVGDTDAWWIAAAGREMAAAHAIPRTNGWSITDPDLPWVMHEWLLAPLYAWGAQRAGSAFIALLGVLGGCATTVALLAAQRRAGVRDDTAAWSVFAALLALQASAVSPRPGYLLLALPLAMLALTRAPRWRARDALAAVALEALWTNAHGSFPIGLALLGAAVVRAEGRDRRARALTLALASLVTLANPYGAGLHALVLRYVRGGDPMAELLRREVLEFRPLWTWPEPFANPWVVTACVGITALALRALRDGPRAARVDALLALALVAMGASQARHLALASVLGLALLSPSLEALRAPRASWTLPRARWLVALPLALALALVASRPRDHVSPALGGASLARLATQPPDARAWVPFDATGWFLWSARAHRDARLLFDARNDCHRAEVARDALALERGAARCATLDARGLNTLIAPTDHPAAQAVLRCEGWRRTATDGAWTRLEREGQLPRIGHTSPVAGLTRPGWSLQ